MGGSFSAQLLAQLRQECRRGLGIGLRGDGLWVCRRDACRFGVVRTLAAGQIDGDRDLAAEVGEGGGQGGNIGLVGGRVAEH